MVLTSWGREHILKMIFAFITTSTNQRFWQDRNYVVNQIGVGDGTDPPTVNDTDLSGSNTTWAHIGSNNVTYAAGVITVTHTFSANEANHDWAEFGLRTNNPASISGLGDPGGRRLLMRDLFPNITTKTSNASRTVSWTLKI